VDERTDFLVPVVRDGPVNAFLSALPARDSVTDAEHGDDGLLSTAGGWKILSEHGTAILVAHRAPRKTARDVVRRNGW